MDGEGKVRRCTEKVKGEICTGSEVEREGTGRRCRGEEKEKYVLEVK